MSFVTPHLRKNGVQNPEKCLILHPPGFSELQMQPKKGIGCNKPGFSVIVTP
jgi:hypothetical protein